MLKALYRRLIVLPCKYGGRCQYRTLFSVNNALESRPQCHFRFAKANIAAEKSVHGGLLFHIAFYLVYRPQLVIGLLIVKSFLKIPLPVVIRFKGISLCHLTLCVQLGQFLSHILYCGTNLVPCARPFGGIKLVQPDIAVFAGSHIP